MQEDFSRIIMFEIPVCIEMKTDKARLSRTRVILLKIIYKNCNYKKCNHIGQQKNPLHEKC